MTMPPSTLPRVKSPTSPAPAPNTTKGYKSDNRNQPSQKQQQQQCLCAHPSSPPKSLFPYSIPYNPNAAPGFGLLLPPPSPHDEPFQSSQHQRPLVSSTWSLRQRYLRGIASSNSKKHPWAYRNCVVGLQTMIMEDLGVLGEVCDGDLGIWGGGFNAEWRVYKGRGWEDRHRWLSGKDSLSKKGKESGECENTGRRLGWCTFLRFPRPECEEDRCTAYEEHYLRLVKQQRRRRVGLDPGGAEVAVCLHKCGENMTLVKDGRVDSCVGPVAEALVSDLEILGQRRETTPSLYENLEVVSNAALATAILGEASFAPVDCRAKKETRTQEQTGNWMGGLKRRLSLRKKRGEVETIQGDKVIVKKGDSEYPKGYPTHSVEAMSTLGMGNWNARHSVVHLPPTSAERSHSPISTPTPPLTRTGPSTTSTPSSLTPAELEQYIEPTKASLPARGYSNTIISKHLSHRQIRRIPTHLSLHSEYDGQTPPITSSTHSTAAVVNPTHRSRSGSKQRHAHAEGALARTATVRRVTEGPKVIKVIRPTTSSSSATGTGTGTTSNFHITSTTPSAPPHRVTRKKDVQSLNSNDSPSSITRHTGRQKQNTCINTTWESAWHNSTGASSFPCCVASSSSEYDTCSGSTTSPAELTSSPDAAWSSPESILEEQEQDEACRDEVSFTYSLSQASRLASWDNPTMTMTPSPGLMDLGRVPERRSSRGFRNIEVVNKGKKVLTMKGEMGSRLAPSPSPSPSSQRDQRRRSRQPMTTRTTCFSPRSPSPSPSTYSSTTPTYISSPPSPPLFLHCPTPRRRTCTSLPLSLSSSLSPHPHHDHTNTTVPSPSSLTTNPTQHSFLEYSSPFQSKASNCVAVAANTVAKGTEPVSPGTYHESLSLGKSGRRSGDGVEVVGPKRVDFTTETVIIARSDSWDCGDDAEGGGEESVDEDEDEEVDAGFVSCREEWSH